MVSCKTLSLLGGVSMVRITTLSIGFFVLLLLLSGCTDLTEYDMAFKAGLHIISSEDFSTLQVISDLNGARCLLMYPSNLFVLSTEGTVSRYDSGNMELIEEYQIGSPSPAGFSDIVYCDLKNSAYLIGSLGSIMEISLPGCTVLDEFFVSQSPIELELAPGSGNLFVADGPSNRIHQVSVNNNTTHDNVALYYTFKCMGSSQNPDTMIVGTSGGVYLIDVLSPVDIRSKFLKEVSPIREIIPIPDDTLLVGISSSNDVGIFYLFNPPAVPPLPYFWGGQRIQGDQYKIAMGKDWQHAYVLTYLGNEVSRLYAYNYRSYLITQTVDIPGVPLDLEVSGDGTIYALTTQ